MSVYRRMKTGVPMHTFAIFSRIPNYWRWIQMVPSLRKFSADEVAQERLKIITFYDAHGEAETQKYFQVNRKTIHVWKKKLARSGQRLEALVARSTRPKHVRRMTTDPQVIQFIRELREAHPRLGKEKIKPLLDQHCQALGIPSLAVSTIGKVIQRQHLFFQNRGRGYHDPNSKQAQKQGKKRVPRERVRYAPHPEELGHWQMDTMVRELDRLKIYFYSAIDIKGKVAFSLPYSQLNSQTTKDFFAQLQAWSILPIRDVQTDNGAEFEGEFDAYLHAQHIPHRWSYPRCPRINGCIERYQRTLNEEFIEVHEEAIRVPTDFLRHLGEYLVFYNSERIHHALQKQTPFAYLRSQLQLSKMSVTHTSV
jgi:transposase InsO family protein